MTVLFPGGELLLVGVGAGVLFTQIKKQKCLEDSANCLGVTTAQKTHSRCSERNLKAKKQKGKMTDTLPSKLNNKNANPVTPKSPKSQAKDKPRSPEDPRNQGCLNASASDLNKAVQAFNQNTIRQTVLIEEISRRATELYQSGGQSPTALDGLSSIEADAIKQCAKTLEAADKYRSGDLSLPVKAEFIEVDAVDVDDFNPAAFFAGSTPLLLNEGA